MAFQANAEWNGSKFVVENLRWGASRQIASDGMVSSGFQQGLVHLTVRVMEGDNTFEKSANNPHKPVDSIKINLKKSTEDATRWNSRTPTWSTWLRSSTPTTLLPC